MKESRAELKNFLLSNWQYKVIAFFLALTLWAVLLGRKDVVLTQEMTVEFLLSPNSHIVNRIDQKVRVQLVGSSFNLGRVDQWQDSITIDLSKQTQGWKTIAIERDVFQLPVGVKLQSFSPQTIKVHIGAKGE